MNITHDPTDEEHTHVNEAMIETLGEVLRIVEEHNLCAPCSLLSLSACAVHYMAWFGNREDPDAQLVDIENITNAIAEGATQITLREVDAKKRAH